MQRVLSLVVLSVLFLQAHAAETTKPRYVEEVIVTATHRETNLMATPQAVSAVSGATIERLGAVDMQALFKQIPGLNMTEGATAGGNRYIIRGVSSQTGTLSYAQTFAAISVYLDDVPMTSAQGPARQFGGNLFDVNRVEVLKGPQGTLFGEGSVGGTIRFIQNDPRLNELDYKAKVGVNTLSHSEELGNRVDGMLNVPLGDSAAFRVTAFRNEKAGYYDKLDTREKDSNSETAVGGRLSVLWMPTEELTVKPTFYTVSTENKGNVIGFRPYDENFNARIPGIPPMSDDDVDLYSLNVDYEFEWATLKLFGSYLDRRVHTASEFPGSTARGFDQFIQFNVLTRTTANPTELPAMLAEGFNLSLLNPALPPNQIAFNNDSTAESQRAVYEARLLSSGDGPWRWIAGVFGKSSDDFRRDFQPFLLRPPLGPQTSPVTYAVYRSFYTDPSNEHKDTLDEISVYGEVNYAVNDRLELTLGARISDIDQTIEDSLAETNDRVLSPKAGIAWWATEETLTYFNVTTGFRPGNLNLGQEFNARIFRGAGDSVIPSTILAPNPAMLTGNQAAARALNLVAYDGDSVINYELGVKTRLMDGRVNVTGSVYYFDWKDTILTFTDPLIPSINNLYNDNAGAAHTAGIELEVVASLTDELNFHIGGALNEAELDEAVGNIPKGSPLPYSPDWSVTVGADYTVMLPNSWRLSGMINHSRLAKQFRSLSVSERQFFIPQRYQTDLGLTLSGSDDKWSARLYVNNVTDEDRATLNCSSAGLPQCFTFQMPRAIGLELTVHP